MHRITTTAAKLLAGLVFALSCAAIAAHSLNYLSVQFNPNNPFHVSYASGGWPVPAHFYFAGVALLVAPVQLSQGLRRRWPALHRCVGWLYVGCVTVAGFAGVVLAFAAQGGWSTGASFLALALLWLYTTAMALIGVIGGDIAAHRRWMLRSVALTFAAVTLRIYLGLGLAVFALPFLQAYLIAAWACWPLNLIAVECYLRWSARPQRRGAIESAVGTDSAFARRSA